MIFAFYEVFLMLQGYVNDTLWSLYQYLVKSEEDVYKSDDDIQLRALIYHWMCVRLEDPHCVNRSRYLYSTDRYFGIMCHREFA